MRHSFLLAAAGMAAISGSAFAGGIIRDFDVNTANHSAFSIGAGIFSYSGTSSAANYYGAANPVVLSGSVPNSTAPTASSSNSFFNPDVAANPTSSTPYGSNYLSAFNYYLTTGTGLRNAVYSTSNGFGTATEQSASMPSSYNRNAFQISYNGLGTGAIGSAGAYRANITQQVILTDGGTTGASGFVSSFTISRLITGGADDNTAVVFNIGLLADIEPGGGTGTGTITDLLASGQRGARIAIAGNYAEVIGYGATSAQVGNRSTAAGGLNTASALGGSGELSNSIVNASTAPAVGLVWKGFSLNAGETLTLYTGVAFNQAAVPAPATAALLGLGGLLASRRRR